MSTYFSHFPIITYNGVVSRDITRRTTFVQDVLSNPYVFLPYTVKDGERPEDIAYNYYGTVKATWLVLMANNIVDPYTQWPIPSWVFEGYIISKYQQQSGKTGREVLNWSQDETTLDNVVYYYRETEDGQIFRTSPNTFPYIYDISGVVTGQSVEPGWAPVRVFQYEYDLNEGRRDIQVVDSNYYEQIEREFKRLIKQ